MKSLIFGLKIFCLFQFLMFSLFKPLLWTSLFRRYLLSIGCKYKHDRVLCPDNVWVESMNRKSLLNCERYIFDCEDLFPASLGALRIIGKFSLLIFKRQTYHSLQNLTKFHTKVVLSNFRLYGMVR